MVAVPNILACLKPCEALCKVMVNRSLLFIIYTQTFQMTSTSPIHIYSPMPLRVSTIIIHDSTIGVCPSQNNNFVTLASLSQHLVSE